MDTAKLKKFAQFARRSLTEQVSTKLEAVLSKDSAARREKPEAVNKLEDSIKSHSKEQVIERVAYTWFNRFCALRYMDVNRYNRVGILSPTEGQFQPEILAEAKMGHIDGEMVPERIQQDIFALLDNKKPSQDPQGEAYRLLVVAACNSWHRAMPFLFQKIDDYTELLMPDDLLSGNSILAYTREAMTPDVCKDVEVIGWLYQFYISEKKDQVFESLKRGKKITPENIPAATQLFTPNWIVRYLVENSLGRLWLLNRPESKLAENMEYYIKPEEPEKDFLKIGSPEEIKICDPACGSGHMLVYAFDILYAIYEEEGYQPSEIPEKILANNLYGIEIDERAGELAGFALIMKARDRQRRFFRKAVQPHICVLRNVCFEEGELKDYEEAVGSGLMTASLRKTLTQFEEVDNFGSLTQPELNSVGELRKNLEANDLSKHLFLKTTHRKVLQVLTQTDYLTPKYHVLIANPPYMGGKGMNPRLGAWLKNNYPKSKSDLFAAFIERIMNLSKEGGTIGLMTPFTWMFLGTYEKLRNRILSESTITSLVRPEYHAFFESAYVPICGFTLLCKPLKNYPGSFVDLTEFYGAEVQPKKALEAIKNPNCGWHYLASSADFKIIPKNPIAYWISESEKKLFTLKPLKKFACFKEGLTTANNDLFLRNWYEVSFSRITLKAKMTDPTLVWIPYNKGGSYRKWYGNNLFVIDWRVSGSRIKEYPGSSFRNASYHFRKGATFSALSSGSFAVRHSDRGFAFDSKGTMLFSENDLEAIIAYMNSKVFTNLVKLVAPTLDFRFGTIQELPFIKCTQTKSGELVEISQSDWDAFETSWDFSESPLITKNNETFSKNGVNKSNDLSHIYEKVRNFWKGICLKMSKLEKDNNRLHIEASDQCNHLSSEICLSELTLLSNPYYRYSQKETLREEGIFPLDKKLEKRLLSDSMKEFISYSVGCMFGRYALEKPGLILANQGETIDDYLKQISTPSFPADTDNVIPMLDGDWFTDDISERFRKFLRITFGEDHYEENLKFLEKAIGKDIRKYFLKDFYNDHIKTYKKRPIYWLFSSSKGSFNALIYMHRYRPDTVSIVLNDYLREFRTKLTARLDHLGHLETSADASKTEKTKALKEIENLKKIIDELYSYERDILYPLATEQVEIDLDDGVKVNYAKFGNALKKIPGLTTKEK